MKSKTNTQTKPWRFRSPPGHHNDGIWCDIYPDVIAKLKKLVADNAPNGFGGFIMGYTTWRYCDAKEAITDLKDFYETLSDYAGIFFIGECEPDFPFSKLRDLRPNEKWGLIHIQVGKDPNADNWLTVNMATKQMGYDCLELERYGDGECDDDDETYKDD